MSLNAAEIDLILSELDIEGSRIQKILQPDFSSLLLTLYRPDGVKKLLVSFMQGKCRLHLTERNFAKPEKQQRFVQFLKARIMGGTVISVSHPGKERIVRIEINCSGENTILWIRLWGASPNIMATDENHIILDLFYRRPGRKEVSGERLALPETVSASRGKTSGSSGSGKFTVRQFPEGTTFNNYIDNFYTGSEESEKRERLREKISGRLSKQLSWLRASLKAVTEKLESAGQIESLMNYGNLILSGSYLINKGDKWLETENYYNGGARISIELDPDLSPQENAERYFSRYRKEKTARSSLAGEKQNLEHRLAGTLRLMEEAAGVEDIRELERIASSIDSTQRKKSGDEIPGLEFHSGNYRILAGRSAAENDELLRRHVRGNDYWLHARDWAGGYVFVKYINGKPVPLETLIDAGTLALYFSKGRKSGRGDVYCTQVKYLRRAKNGKKGTVLPTQEKNLSITIDEKRIERLFGRDETRL